jgi:plastocyanin
MAGPPPHYLPGELATPAGHTVLFVTNSSRGTHNVAIGRGPLNFKLGRATNLPLALSGNVLINTSVSFSVDGLPPGAYLFWCTISDHAQEGMTGTLTVTP